MTLTLFEPCQSTVESFCAPLRLDNHASFTAFSSWLGPSESKSGLVNWHQSGRMTKKQLKICGFVRQTEESDF